MTFIAVTQAGAGTVFAGTGYHQPPAGTLKLAGFMLVHPKANEEFAKFGLDVALHRQWHTVAIKSELEDRLGTFHRLALFFIQSQVDLDDQQSHWFFLVSIALVFQ